MDEIIFIGNGRDYHAIDWYRTIKKICTNRNILFATDLIESEGHIKITSEHDHIINLYNIDWLLFKEQSRIGNFWRNFIKFILSPIQVSKIKAIQNKYPDSVFHAHTMYYMFLCWMARVSFIGTPQGSEVLVRPDKSLIYKYFACKSLIAAKHVTVDSKSLHDRIKNLCGKSSIVIQNGINVSTILKKATDINSERTNVTSFRGMYPLYRLEEVLEARDKSQFKPPITFIYPLWEETYRKNILLKFKQGDEDLGRLSQENMYDLFFSTVLAISIPKSDSSPRSVYEAIFCGCCVAVTYNPWMESMPSCMRSRLFIVELEDERWFDKAIEFAKLITKTPFLPSQLALDSFDQGRTMKKAAEMFYEK